MNSRNNFTTTLKNGLRIVSAETGKPHCTIGVYIPMGSRHEINSPFGRTRAFQLAFQNRSNSNSSQPIRCETSRDCLSFTIDSLISDVGNAFSQLISSFLQLGNQKQQLKIGKYDDLFDPMANPDIALSELLHETSFGGLESALGRRKPETISKNDLIKIKQKDIEVFINDLLSQRTISKAVIACAGIEHSKLVDLVVTSPLISVPVNSIFKEKEDKEHQNVKKTLYKGGNFIIGSEEIEPKLKGPTAHLSHLGIVVPSFGLSNIENNDKNGNEIFTSMVASAVLGGGRSFSQGGPGKGIFTRLYQRMMNEPWIEAMNSFHSPFSEIGLFGVSGSCEARYTRNLLLEMITELVSLGISPIQQKELERAKTMLFNSLSFAVEQTSVLCDDIGKQTLLRNGSVDIGKSLESKIQKVTSQDIQRMVCNSILSENHHQPLTIVGILPKEFHHSIHPIIKDIDLRLKSLLKTLRL